MTVRKPPQWQVVRDALRAAGSRGVHTFELRQAYIGNPSQRIADLEKQGYVISSTRERLNGDAIGSRYVLVSEPSQVTPKPPAADYTYADQTVGLFDSGTSKPASAIYGDDWESAA